jgi:hypothetical protein
VEVSVEYDVFTTSPNVNLAETLPELCSCNHEVINLLTACVHMSYEYTY